MKGVVRYLDLGDAAASILLLLCPFQGFGLANSARPVLEEEQKGKGSRMGEVY